MMLLEEILIYVVAWVINNYSMQIFRHFMRNMSGI